MSKSLKVIPLKSIPTDIGDNITSFDIISPTSWEVNTATNVIQEQGIIGNVVLNQLPLKERTFSLDWVGPKKEINKILNYLTKSSSKYFLFGNLSDQDVVSPGIMFDSYSMLASVADSRKLPGESYRDYLPFFYGEGFNPGSLGVRVVDKITNYAEDYAHLNNSNGIEPVVFLPKGVSYTFRLNPVAYSVSPITNPLHNLKFKFLTHRVDMNTVNSDSGQISLDDRNDYFTLDSVNYDRVMRLTMQAPTTFASSGNMVAGVVNYVPLIIHNSETTPTLDDYEDIPSLLRPVDDFIYNIISPNIAELSMNFKEILYDTE